MNRRTIIILVAVALIAVILVIVFRKQIMGESLTAGNRRCCKWDALGNKCLAYEGEPICGSFST